MKIISQLKPSFSNDRPLLMFFFNIFLAFLKGIGFEVCLNVYYKHLKDWNSTRRHALDMIWIDFDRYDS